MVARFCVATNATISCKILVKISPVVSAESILIDGNCAACLVGSEMCIRDSRIYWTDFRNLFTIAYENALRADDGFVKLFPDLSIDVATCLLYTSPSPRDRQKSRMPSSA